MKSSINPLTALNSFRVVNESALRNDEQDSDSAVVT